MAALRLRDGLYGLILILRMASHAHLGVPITLPTRASGAGAFKPEANIRSQAKSGNAKNLANRRPLAGRPVERVVGRKRLTGDRRWHGKM